MLTVVSFKNKFQTIAIGACLIVLYVRNLNNSQKTKAYTRRKTIIKPKEKNIYGIYYNLKIKTEAQILIFCT